MIIKNMYGFLVETKESKSKNICSFGKPKERLKFMTKKQILDTFYPKKKELLSFGKKKTSRKIVKPLTKTQRTILLKKVMKIKNEKGVSLKKAWILARK